MKLERHKFLLEDEAKRLLQAARSRFCRTRKRRHIHAARDYALLAVGFNTGLRAIELTGIRIGDLRGVIGPTRAERPAKVRVRRAKKREEVWEELALPDTARTALVEHLGELGEKHASDRVFPISVRQVERLFKYYLKAAGLDTSYSPHAMRHARGVMLYEKHRDLTIVKAALGHASIASTEQYLHAVDLQPKLAATDVSPNDPAPAPEEKTDGRS